MAINILEHNPYIDVLQVKAAHVKNYDDFKEIAMVMDYTENKQMAAILSGEVGVEEVKTAIDKESIKKEMENDLKEESPMEIMRRIAEEEGYNLGGPSDGGDLNEV